MNQTYQLNVATHKCVVLCTGKITPPEYINIKLFHAVSVIVLLTSLFEYSVLNLYLH